MGADAILQAIAEETAHEVDRVLADARARARQRVKEATRAAQVRVDEAVAAVEPELRAEAARQVNVTRVELLHARARATAARLDSVYARADQRLAAIVAADGHCWREALVRMAQEALAATGPASTLAVRPTDIEALEGQGGALVTISNHPFTPVPGQPAVVSTSKRLSVNDYGISLDLSGKNGFYSAFAYQS